MSVCFLDVSVESRWWEDIRSNWPILRGCQLGPPEGARLLVPGFFAPQSAQVLLPGTVLIKSCRARSLRACWRLFRTEAMIWRSSGSYGGRKVSSERQERTLSRAGDGCGAWGEQANWQHRLTSWERFHDRARRRLWKKGDCKGALRQSGRE